MSSKKKKKIVAPKGTVEKEVITEVLPGAPPFRQKEPTAAEIIKSMKDEITLATEDGKDRIMRIFNRLVQELAGATHQINANKTEIERLTKLCLDHKIDIKPPKPVQPKQPNRQERRAMERKAGKNTPR